MTVSTLNFGGHYEPGYRPWPTPGYGYEPRPYYPDPRYQPPGGWDYDPRDHEPAYGDYRPGEAPRWYPRDPYYDGGGWQRDPYYDGGWQRDRDYDPRDYDRYRRW